MQGLARSVFGPTSTRRVDGDGIGLTEIARMLPGSVPAPVTPQLGGIRCPVVVLGGRRGNGGHGPALAWSPVRSRRAPRERTAGRRTAHQAHPTPWPRPHARSPAERATIPAKLSAPDARCAILADFVLRHRSPRAGPLHGSGASASRSLSALPGLSRARTSRRGTGASVYPDFSDFRAVFTPLVFVDVEVADLSLTRHRRCGGGVRVRGDAPREDARRRRRPGSARGATTR